MSEQRATIELSPTCRKYAPLPSRVVRVLLLGDSKAGKTQLLECIRNKLQPTPLLVTRPPTVGVENQVIRWRPQIGPTTSITFYDASGAPRYRPMALGYLNSVDIAVVMCNEKLDGLQHWQSDINRWKAERANQFKPPPVLMLLLREGTAALPEITPPEFALCLTVDALTGRGVAKWINSLIQFYDRPPAAQKPLNVISPAEDDDSNEHTKPDGLLGRLLCW
jgi:hypothetical protein